MTKPQLVALPLRRGEATTLSRDIESSRCFTENRSQPIRDKPGASRVGRIGRRAVGGPRQSGRQWVSKVLKSSASKARARLQHLRHEGRRPEVQVAARDSGMLHEFPEVFESCPLRL